MLPESRVSDAVRDVIIRWMPGAQVAEIRPLTPDASLRRYFRVLFEPEHSQTPTSLVAMFFDSVASPEAAGAQRTDADDAYVLLTDFFRAGNVRVPDLVFDARGDSILIIEDLGDIQLATIVANTQPDSHSPTLDRLLDEALDEILKIQSIQVRADFFACQRSFTPEQYSREMSEFTDYILKPIGRSTEDIRVKFSEWKEDFAKSLGEAPPMLTHRDFHGWNLMVTDERIRVIDFQDALMATAPYDLVSLINDRDMDSLLGPDRYARLVKRFSVLSCAKDGTALGDFADLYDRVLLQRDLKVAGRFSKLSTERGLKQYEQWIPGTLRRIGRTMVRVEKRLTEQTSARTTRLWQREIGAIRASLEQVLPLVRDGAVTPWRVHE